MFCPGEVYISAKEMAFAYVESRSLRETHIRWLEAYLKKRGLTSEEFTEKLTQFTMRPIHTITGNFMMNSLN